MAKKAIDLEARTVSFDFGDAGTEEFQLDNCSEAIKLQLMLHGASQKIGDSYASAKKASEELNVNPAAWSREQANGVIGQLYNDDWTVRQPGVAAVTDLARAISEAYGAPVEAIVEKLADTSKEDKAALRKDPKVKAVIERIRLERQQAKLATAEAKAETTESSSAIANLLG